MPAIVLHRPQVAENVGSAARVLANFGLADLRLVAPKPALDDPRAVAAAASGRAVLDAARVFSTLPDAIADLHHVYATSAMPRHLPKANLSPAELGDLLRARAERRCGVVFGPEPSGLSNAELALAEALVHIPTASTCRAMNLSHAVCVVVYQWSRASDARVALGPEPAEQQVFERAFEGILDRATGAGWASEPGLREHAVRNLRSLLLRAAPSEVELATLRGLVETVGRGG